MDATLHQLGQLLLRAIPTFLIVVGLHFLLKNLFFKPMGKVLHERYEATEGAKKLAEESLEKAAAKTAGYEEALRVARAAVYLAQEKVHRQLEEQAAAEVAEARKRSDAVLSQAREALAKEVEGAKAALAADSEALADQISEAVLRRSAA